MERLKAITDEEMNDNQFIVESECSLFLDKNGKESTSSADALKSDQDENSQIDISMFSLYKDRNSPDVFVSDFNSKFLRNFPQPITKTNERKPSINKHEQPVGVYRPKSVDFTKSTQSPWKGSKSSKSVTFTSQDNPSLVDQDNNESAISVEAVETEDLPSKPICSRLMLRDEPILETRESDLWYAFLMETGLISPQELIAKTLDTSYHNIKAEDLEFVLKQFGCSYEQTSDKTTSNIRDDYQDIHRQRPGLFWDTINMDNPNRAFYKAKRIVREIVKSQPLLHPMMDIDFASADDYPIINTRLEKIRKDIAPQRLFY